MTPALRKRHRIFWMILAIVLPLLFLAAVLSIPETVTQEELYLEIKK